MNLRLGLRCTYRPRVPYGRQSELFCFVSRVVNAEKGIADLIAFPTNSEPVHYNNVARKSDVIQIHCWEPAESDETSDVSGLVDMIDALERRLAEQDARLVALETKRGPGRPPNPDKAVS